MNWALAPSALVKAMFECIKKLFQVLALCPGLELLFWSLPTKALVSVFSPVSCSPDFATTSNCSGKVLEKEKFTVFLRLIAFELEACLLNSATHFKCFLPFIWLLLVTQCSLKACSYIICSIFSIFPFFACCSSCFFPSSNPLFPCVDTTATTEPAVHGWYHIPVYLISQRCWVARQAWEGEAKKGNVVFKGKPCFRWTALINITSFLRLESLSGLVISVVSSTAGCSSARQAPIPQGPWKHVQAVPRNQAILHSSWLPG